jgi:hypothetical protein
MMSSEHPTGRRVSRSQWLMVALSICLALAVALSMALAGDAEAKKKKRAKNYTRVDTTQQAAVNQITQASNPLTAPGLPWIFGGTNKIRTITNVSVTLRAGTILAPDPDLRLGLDGINTGIPITLPVAGQFNNVTATGTPQNQAQIVQALKADGQLVGTIIDLTPGNNLLGVDGTAQTTLTLKGKLQKKRR